MSETDFRLGETTLFEHFYQILAVVKRAYPTMQYCTPALSVTSWNLGDVMRIVGSA
jgi:hypothetical protein